MPILTHYFVLPHDEAKMLINDYMESDLPGFSEMMVTPYTQENSGLINVVLRPADGQIFNALLNSSVISGVLSRWRGYLVA